MDNLSNPLVGKLTFLGPRIAIVGSRNWPRPEQVRSVINDLLPDNITVVSGGARGVDTWAEEAARARGLKVVIYPAYWDRFGRSAGYIRNEDIVANCDEVIAFWDQHSRGTKHTIDIARRDGKPVHIFYA